MNKAETTVPLHCGYCERRGTAHLVRSDKQERFTALSAGFTAFDHGRLVACSSCGALAARVESTEK